MYTFGKHPEAKRAGSVFKWAVFHDGQLFEGFIRREDAEAAAKEYNTERLEQLRGELRAERISYGALAELRSLAPFIDPDDVELREAAGIPETN